MEIVSAVHHQLVCLETDEGEGQEWKSVPLGSR